MSGFTHTIECATRAQAHHLLGERVGSAAIPSVGEDHDGRALAMPRTPHESLNSRRQSPKRATRPVDDPPRGRADRGVGIARRELARHAREPGAERERLDPGPTDDRGVQEAHERARVRLHRATHVEQEHESTGALPSFERRPMDRLTTGTERGPDRAAQVGATGDAVRSPQATRPPERGREPEVGDQPAGLDELGRRVRGEVAVAQDLGRAPADGQHRHLRIGLARRFVGVGLLAVGVEREHDLDRRRRAAQLEPRAGVERRERAVVHRDVFGAGHERRASGPVDPARARQADGGECLA